MIAPKFGFDFGPKFTTKKISTLAFQFTDQIGNGNFGMNRNQEMNVIVFTVKFEELAIQLEAGLSQQFVETNEHGIG